VVGYIVPVAINYSDKLCSSGVYSGKIRLWHGDLFLNLDFQEGCDAEMDSNFVMPGDWRFIEIRATGEQQLFASEQLLGLMQMAKSECQKLIDLQKQILE
jgi:ribonuclease PH